MIEPRDVYNQAAALRRQYHALNHAKHTKEQAPRGSRIMKSTPGPRVPGNFALISFDKYLTDWLAEMVRDVANHVCPTAIITRNGEELCLIIEDYHLEVAELDFVDDLMELMASQEQVIEKKLHPPTVTDLASRPEPRQLSSVIINKLKTHGHTVTRNDLHKWAHRGHITTSQRNGRSTYLLSEVLSYLQSRH